MLESQGTNHVEELLGLPAGSISRAGGRAALKASPTGVLEMSVGQFTAPAQAALRGIAGSDQRSNVESMLGLTAGTLGASSAFQAAMAGSAAAHSGEAHLLPEGEFTLPGSLIVAGHARGGPPQRFRMNGADGAVIASRLASSVIGHPLVVDYELATLATRETGKPAPAAGWIVGADWQAGQGLMARVVWTERARLLIEEGQYRFASPVVAVTGDSIIAVLLAGVAASPAIPGLMPLRVF